MRRHLRLLTAASPLLLASLIGGTASAQNTGGVLRIYHWDSPASMSIHEEATYSTVVPMMGVFNNLVVYKQDEPKNSLKSIVPDLATRWSWSEDGLHLTFPLREGSNGMTARHLPQGTSNALGRCCSVDRMRSCAPIPGRPGTRTWTGSPRIPTTRRPFI